ncbi:hypothetical protein SD427_01025 [Chryseobacterium sp. JJR-5R]|uniref:hypothetical protein n=1 Tax=Chryseobacterium sp. JJR-5R TaxID=3093923 RepID=UPI002A755DE5|nr:hypothetical protein [Chryseobacterium sp. JJR-5R]WPO82955.1 hypothetical protein SD427_01025 [Chryseobacterium sp. JJR-5R]
MKKLVLLLFFLFGMYTFSQTAAVAKEVFGKIKKDAKIDSSDRTIYNLLDELYAQNLQAENDEMKPETIEKVQKLASDPGTKNIHLLMLFLMYQQHISQTAAAGKKTDPEFQTEMIELLKDETKSVYGILPAIIFIYEYEALERAGKTEEAKMAVSEGLKMYPDSVPLKVYSYLNTKDEALKNDLVKNHPGHWMVKQFQIK